MTFERGTPDRPRNRIVCNAFIGVEAGTLAVVECREVFDNSNPAAHLGDTASGLRQAAREVGWTRIPPSGPASPAEDRCPEHRPRLPNAGRRGGF